MLPRLSMQEGEEPEVPDRIQDAERSASRGGRGGFVYSFLLPRFCCCCIQWRR